MDKALKVTEALLKLTLLEEVVLFLISLQLLMSIILLASILVICKNIKLKA